MAQRKSVRGPRSSVLWLAIILILVLAIALAAVVFVIGPERQLAVRATATAQAHASEVQRAYDAGVAFAEAGDWEKAAEEFARVVGLEPGYKDADARLAEVKDKLAESAAAATVEAQVMATAQAEATAEAQANARATAVAAPTATAEALEVQYQKALGYINMGQWDEAKAELEQVFEVDPNYKDVQAKLAEAEAKLAAIRALIPTATLTITPGPSPTALPTATSTPGPTSTPRLTNTPRPTVQAANWKEDARRAVVDYFESWKDRNYDAMFSLISNAKGYKVGSAEELRQLYSNTRTTLQFYSVGQGEFEVDMASAVFPVDFDVESAAFPTMRVTRNIKVGKSGTAWVVDYWGLCKVVRPAESQSLKQNPDSGGSEGTYSITIDRVLLWTDFTVVATTETWRPTDTGSPTRWYQGVKSAQLQDNFGNSYTFQPAKSSPLGTSYSSSLKETGESQFGWLYFDGNPPTDALYLRLFLIPQDSKRQITFERLELQ